MTPTPTPCPVCGLTLTATTTTSVTYQSQTNRQGAVLYPSYTVSTTTFTCPRDPDHTT